MDDEFLGQFGFVVVDTIALLVPERFCTSCRRLGGVEEWITAFGAEKMKLVVVSKPKSGVLDRNEASVYNGSVAIMTSRGELLQGGNIGGQEVSALMFLDADKVRSPTS